MGHSSIDNTGKRETVSDKIEIRRRSGSVILIDTSHPQPQITALVARSKPVVLITAAGTEQLARPRNKSVRK
jgi:hypothetical protein